MGAVGAKYDDAGVLGFWDLRITKGFTCGQIQGKFWDIFVFKERGIGVNISLSQQSH